MVFTKIEAECFREAYAERILANSGEFVEDPRYYSIYRERYRRTAELLGGLGLAPGSSMLEVGGGQIGLLADALFGFDVTVADVSDEFAGLFEGYGLSHCVCDLLYDEPPAGPFDAVVLCEVIEHLAKPPCTVLPKLVERLKPGGSVFVTTPNLTRLRNIYKLATGRSMLAPWFIPDRGRGVGHVIEYDRRHLAWQLERSGLVDVEVRCVQMTARASAFSRQVGKLALLPLTMRASWREGLVGVGRRPAGSDRDTGVAVGESGAAGL